MTIKTTNCITVTCDVCGDPYDEDGMIRHFDTAEEAADLIDDDDWYWHVRPDGRAVCASTTDEHNALRDALKAEAEQNVEVAS